MGNQTAADSYHVTNGRLYQNISWYPSAGWRQYNGGILNGVGFGCYFWSLNVNGSTAKSFYFTMNDINIDNYDRRANAFSIRCVQE